MILKGKQIAFVQEYLIDLNATQAAIRAGYSKKTAKEIGCENLTKPHIAKAIRQAFKKREERVEITQDLVLAGLLTEAQLSTDRASHSARVSAWEKLGKHLGIFEKDNTQNNIAAIIAVLSLLPTDIRSQIKDEVFKQING